MNKQAYRIPVVTITCLNSGSLMGFTENMYSGESTPHVPGSAAPARHLGGTKSEVF